MAKNNNVGEVEKPTSPDIELEKEKSKVTWQFKYKNYVHIMPWVDDSLGTTRDGRKINETVKARNWRLDLDLSDPKQKRTHEELLRASARTNAFYLLTGREHEDKAKVRAKTLEKLLEMDLNQLKSMFDPIELEHSGLTGNVTKAELITALMDTKKLVGGE